MNKQKVNLKDIAEQTGSSSNFTGTVHIQPIADSQEKATFGMVTFEKGAHTVWHMHSGGQVLLFQEGKGRVQIGDTLIDAQPGDIIRIPPNTRHWHGAHPEEKNHMRHIAITIGENTWFEQVPEGVYKTK
jgi:4-carboxymuconolactone decarboxylase